jgi:hypothetical protein
MKHESMSILKNQILENRAKVFTKQESQKEKDRKCLSLWSL